MIHCPMCLQVGRRGVHHTPPYLAMAALIAAKAASQAAYQPMLAVKGQYSTTNEELAVRSTLELAEKLKASGSFTLYITHQHGLEAAQVPFLSVIVDQDDQNRRTYRIARRLEAEGSYAADILRRYGLDEEALSRRFGGNGGAEA